MAKNVKRLYRASEKDSMIGGVCAGIADYFDVHYSTLSLTANQVKADKND